MFNNNEKIFIGIINEAKEYVKGELELDNFDGKWFAMDYREDLEGAFPIKAKDYDEIPLITDEAARRNGIDIIKCCDECGISYVG